jgi:hypothetical protein
MAIQTTAYSVYFGTGVLCQDDIAFAMFLLDQDDPEGDAIFAPVEPAEMAPSVSVQFDF